jgi:hypothetical protein
LGGDEADADILDEQAQNIVLKRGRRKTSWTICRIPVRPFVYVVKAGQPPGPKIVTGKDRYRRMEKS